MAGIFPGHFYLEFHRGGAEDAEGAKQAAHDLLLLPFSAHSALLRASALKLFNNVRQRQELPCAVPSLC
jgi:hypothetical protein